MDKNESYDNNSYLKFTFKSQLDKAIHTIEGIIKGITIDNIVNETEIEQLFKWLKEYNHIRNKSPFNELIPMLEKFLEDKIITNEEQKDILWFCDRLTTKNVFYNVVTSDMQRLYGILAGISADNIIEKAELDRLSEWLENHENLKKCWPYDEIYSLVTSVLRDNKIDEQEHKFLMAYFREVNSFSPSLIIEPNIDEDLIRNGVCAICPEIIFKDHIFCFTGKSSHGSRKKLSNEVIQLQGTVVDTVTNNLDYLIIGNEGNPCWAFSCYGRKVEEAILHRKNGLKIQLVHENDFWDAVQDAK